MKEAPRLHVCGHFQVQRCGDLNPLRRLRTRKTEWLCCFLAVQRERWQTREALIDRFWPDDELLAARRKLRLALHSIRQAVGDSLQSEGDKVCLADVWVDALDQGSEELNDFELLLGEHEGTLSDLMPQLEEAWIKNLAARLKEEEDPESKVRIAVKLNSLSPFNTLAAEVLAVSRLAAPILTKRSASHEPTDSWSDHLLANLSLHLLGGKEPAAAALIGPPGVGKTHLARRLTPLAQIEEVIPLFVSLQGVSDARELESLVHQSLLASQGQKAPLNVRDLASTLLVLDNADDLTAESQDVFDSLLTEGSPIRLLITLPVDQFTGFAVFRHKPMALPKDSSPEAIHSSEAAQYLAQKAGIDLAQTDPDAVHSLCLRSGGLPLALQHSAKELLFSGSAAFSLAAERTSPHHAVSDRLTQGYLRLNQPQKEALVFLAKLGHQFHPRLACSLGVEQPLIQQLWERSWLQHTPDGRAFELLPAVRSFVGSQPTTGELPDDWPERLGRLAQGLIEEDYLQVSEVFGPTDHLLDQALAGAAPLQDDVRDQLFAALYFCRLKQSDLGSVVSLGRRLYGDQPSELWQNERGLNFLGSAAYFDQDYPLAERLFRHLMSSQDGGLRSVAFCNAGLIAQAMGQHHEAATLLAESLNTPDLKPRQKVARLNNLAHALAGAGAYDEAKQAASSALELIGDSQNLREMRSLALVTLGGVSLCEGQKDLAMQWSELAVASWGEDGPILRRLEAVFLKLTATACMEPAALQQTLGRLVPRSAKGPPAAAHYWSQFAAGVLSRAGLKAEAANVIIGRPWPTTPFWLTPSLGAEPSGWNPPHTPSPSNRERWFLFLDALKRL